MVRNYPRTTRRRAMAALVTGTLLLALAAIPPVSADDLDDRQDRVRGDINQTLHDLDQSSTQLLAANRALRVAQSTLARAERYLAKTRGELAVAEVLDRQMQARLNAAVERLVKAREDLGDGRVLVADQEKLLGQFAVQNYQTGDPNLLGLSMVLTSRDPAELTSQLNSVQNVLDKEAVTLDRLEASRILLTVQEQEVEDAKVAVAAQREVAADNLKRKQRLEEQAASAEEQVSNLVRRRAKAQDAAVKAREADLDRLRALQQERSRISEMLRKRAEAARRAADMAASSGSLDSRGFLNYPLDGNITSGFGMRFHPVYHQWALHDGTDFGAACGAPIRAASGGTVIARYFNAGYGNRVIVDNGFRRGVGLGTSYNHLSGYSTFVGARVERGEIIGYVGTTGYSTGCHLHFMVFENGAAVNPMRWL